MKANEGNGIVRRVSGSRWFPGVATAIVLMSAIVVGGLAWASSAPSGAVGIQAPSSIRMQFSDPTAPGGVSDWIEIDSFQWGVGRPMSAGLPTGDLVTTQVTVTKSIDKASPKLADACTKGEHLGEVTIELTRASAQQTAYLQIEMENTLISSYSISAGSQGGAPTEQITFTFEKITKTYASGDKVTHECGGWQGLFEEIKGTCSQER
ncbi:MAG: hypothetical protein A3K65_07705 [Euryarchaeota archaeon RBG_16_68_12]|nr:MAG: hypothetical protein A3K65_07705 [Euryarchaeota archaeon RBG_16_68_12]